MENPVVMEIIDCTEQLGHECLDLARSERLGHGVHESLQVMLHILHHNEDLVHVVAHHYLLQSMGVWFRREETTCDRRIVERQVSGESTLTGTNKYSCRRKLKF